MQVFEFGPFRFDASTRSLYRSGEFVPVTPKALDTLAVLLVDAGRLVTKDELLQRVWPDAVVEEGSIANNISILRKVLNPYFDQGPIATVARKGYRFAAPVHVCDAHVDSVPGEPAPAPAPDSPAPVIPPASRSWTWPAAIAGVLLVAGTISTIRVTSRDARASAPSVRRAIAVLSMKNLSGRDEYAWLSTALAEAIDTELAHGGQLRVVSGSAVAQMQQWLAPPPGVGLGRKQLDEIGRTLGCDLILTGNYTAAGGRIRVDTQLDDIASGRQIATFSVSDDEGKLLDLVAASSRELRAKLGLVTPGSTGAETHASLSSNPDALRFYFLGLDALRINDAARSAELLTQATADDPDFAIAHSTLSIAWRVLGYDAKSQAEARRAFELSTKLSREDQLSVEGTYYQVMSQFPKAIERFQTLWSSYPDDISYALKLFHAEMMGGRMDEARRVIDQMKAMPPPADRDPRVDVVEAAWLAREGRLRDALAADASAAGKATKAKSTELLAAIKLNEGGVHRQLRAFDEAMRDFDEAERLFETVGEPAGSGDALRGMARVLLDRGHPEEAAQRLEQAAALATRVHAQRLLIATQISQSEVSRRLGHLANARDQANSAIAAARETQSRSPLALALIALGAAETERQERAPARAHLEEAERIGHEIGEPPVFAEAAASLTRLDLAEGRVADAKRRLDAIMPVARRTGDKQLAGELETLARVLKAEAKAGQAKRVSTERSALGSTH